MQKFSFQLSADPEKEFNFWTCHDASVTRKATKILLLLLFYESRQRKKPNTVYDDTRRPQGSAFRNKEQQCRNDWPMSYQRVSMGWCLLRLSAKILALLRLSVNFLQLRLTKKLKINFFCFKKLNIN